MQKSKESTQNQVERIRLSNPKTFENIISSKNVKQTKSSFEK